jgi:hypothetical protein
MNRSAQRHNDDGLTSRLHGQTIRVFPTDFGRSARLFTLTHACYCFGNFFDLHCITPLFEISDGH